jgi:hypothetical protein
MAVIDPWIDAELRNWARWCWAGALPHPMPPTHCRSIEHRYIAPSDLGRELDAEEIARRIPIIRDRAEIVHRVYRERLARIEQQVLAFEYVHGPADESKRRRKARKLRSTMAAYEQTLISAAQRVGDAFREARV